jgi:hypothetical protein
MRRCILLLVDGLRPDVAERGLAAGDLPNLGAMVKGGGIARAITAFPSTTSVAYLPFLTGCTPGSCNVPSIRWLDRRRYGGCWWRERDSVRSYCGYQAGRLDDDITPEIRTIFQLVPDSLAIFSMITRGLDGRRDAASGARKFWGALAHYTGWHQPSDDIAASRLLREVENPWRFIFAQFPATDGYSHGGTADSPRVLRALRKVDDMVGRLRSALECRGELEETLILLVSDHGSAPVSKHLDLADWFRARGVATLAHPVLWTRDPQVAVMVAGNGSAMVYAQPGRSRSCRWPLNRLRKPAAFGTGEDLVSALVREPAVAFVAGEDGGGGVRVVGVEGEATIRTEGDTISYLPLTGDVLRFGGPITLTATDWLERSWESTYPDAPCQLLDQFRASRTGDLVVVAREGFDLRERFEIPEHRAGHGSLIRAHMQTPLWSSQPLGGTHLRTADLFPAMLNWLQLPVPEGIDGCPVWLPGTLASRTRELTYYAAEREYASI